MLLLMSCQVFLFAQRRRLIVLPPLLVEQFPFQGVFGGSARLALDQPGLLLLLARLGGGIPQPLHGLRIIPHHVTDIVCDRRCAHMLTVCCDTTRVKAGLD